MKKRVTKKPPSWQHSPIQSNRFVILFLFTLMLLSVVAIIQSGNQDTRNRAQELTPTPLLRCDVPCTYHSQCPTGLFCHQGMCRNPSCPDTAGCACVITPTPNPLSQVQPTRIPTTIPTSRPTVAPSPTESIIHAPTIVVSPTPISPYEAYATEPKNLTFFQAVISFMGDIFCRIFGVC